MGLWRLKRLETSRARLDPSTAVVSRNVAGHEEIRPQLEDHPPFQPLRLHGAFLAQVVRGGLTVADLSAADMNHHNPRTARPPTALLGAGRGPRKSKADSSGAGPGATAELQTRCSAAGDKLTKPVTLPQSPVELGWAPVGYRRLSPTTVEFSAGFSLFLSWWPYCAPIRSRAGQPSASS